MTCEIRMRRNGEQGYAAPLAITLNSTRRRTRGCSRGQTMLELKLVMMAESSTRCVGSAERSGELDDDRMLGAAMRKRGDNKSRGRGQVGRGPEPWDQI
jgi:hypothetical protein